MSFVKRFIFNVVKVKKLRWNPTYPEDEVKCEEYIFKELKAATAIVAAFNLDGTHRWVGLALSPPLEGIAGLWGSDDGGWWVNTSNHRLSEMTKENDNLTLIYITWGPDTKRNQVYA